jgi:hypothetical protein
MEVSEMKRLALALIVAVGLVASTAGPAVANKNAGVVEAECSNGETYQVKVNFLAGEKSGENSGAPIVGGGSFKTTEIRLFFEGTEVVHVTSNYPKDATVTCTGTVFEPREELTLDFIVSGVPRPEKSA